MRVSNPFLQPQIKANVEMELAMGIERFEVPLDSLTQVCNPDDLGFDSTDEIDPLSDTIGQERAVSAMELALDLDAPGYNLFVAGLPGTGRNTALKSYLDRVSVQKEVPPDWGYVHNFDDPSQPKAISLPCGMMRELSRDMDNIIDTCRHQIPLAFESNDYGHRIEDVMKDIQAKRQQMTDTLEQEAQKEGFTLQSTQVGITPVPLIEGRPMTQEEFTGLSDEDRDSIRIRAETIQRAIAQSLQELRRLTKEAEERTKEVDTEFVRFTLTPIINELQEKYQDIAQVVDYLDHVENDMVEHLDMFKPVSQPQPQIPGMPMQQSSDEDTFGRYRVNDLVDNLNCPGAPVIFEYSPTYYNLFGRIDYKPRVGTFTTDLTMIKPGAFHRANGGYLVLQARDLLMNPMSWDTLKRTLRSEEIRIENIGDQLSPLPSVTLRPEPIPINTKIVLVGGFDIVRVLQTADEDFLRYFKVTADFDTFMERSQENMMKYAAFVAARAADKGLRPFHKSAVAKVIDYSSRLVEDQGKLTTRFMHVSDIITEADYWAGRENGSGGLVMSDHVKKAIDHREYRVSMTEDRLREMISNNTIHIATEGHKAGQVNGLAVYSIGEHTFGKPSRITARVSLGRGQVTNIERETQMSGKIHDKGFMILSGYMNGKYGRNKPLSLSASIGFEQTYSEIDGDSASSTELYALLSEISEQPINQGIAVTGSVNQAGEVQAIGGATYKIEGYFDICVAKGLTGDQGVMIPKDNVKHLVLKDEVVESVRRGDFHIYAVESIDEGLEVLTGLSAGQVDGDGKYPEGSMHFLVEAALDEMAQTARNFGKDADDKGDDESDKVTEVTE